MNSKVETDPEKQKIDINSLDPVDRKIFYESEIARLKLEKMYQEGSLRGFSNDELRELLFFVENCKDDGGYASRSQIWNKVNAMLDA